MCLPLTHYISSFMVPVPNNYFFLFHFYHLPPWVQLACTNNPGIACISPFVGCNVFVPSTCSFHSCCYCWISTPPLGSLTIFPLEDLMGRGWKLSGQDWGHLVGMNMEVFLSGSDKWCPYLAKNIHILPLTPSIDLGLYFSPYVSPPVLGYDRLGI